MCEFYTVPSNRKYSEKPQDSNNKNIRINGFITVSPQGFIIENRVKATGPRVSCYMPFCGGATWSPGRGRLDSDRVPAHLQQALLPRGTRRAPRGFGMLSEDVKAKTSGADSTGHYILETVSTVLTVASSVKAARPTESPSVPRRLRNQPHTEIPRAITRRSLRCSSVYGEPRTPVERSQTSDGSISFEFLVSLTGCYHDSCQPCKNSWRPGLHILVI